MAHDSLQRRSGISQGKLTRSEYAKPTIDHPTFGVAAARSARAGALSASVGAFGTGLGVADMVVTAHKVTSPLRPADFHVAAVILLLAALISGVSPSYSA